MEFRLIQDSDLDACAKSLMATFKAEPWNENWTYDEALMRIDELMASRMSRGYVIEDGMDIVGMCIGRVMTYTGFRELWIDEFRILPTHQGKNLGSELLAFVKAALNKENIENYCLTTIKGYPSVKFYEKNGFKQSETVIFMHN